ncbi:AtpZ/AtpI family protein [Fodinibius salsisoli]|uniref:AtpZ/AtpI family protein n=1 Tax=Fodinibius salsisoli TaxID=2820877 RepID=A0ABT3PIV4_9BACT|nr:AtpZ/AtpI family protein [Fodinibius salsisoli]MCW9705851.1 AtpZ/AtpI family protein [Fodinibius salsisoli]
MSTANEEHKPEEFAEEIREKSLRKIRSQKEKRKGLWHGLGMFGLVGWSVATPTLLLLLLGIWIDGTYESKYSWTLMMLVIGICLGCMNAWYWIKRESEG